MFVPRKLINRKILWTSAIKQNAKHEVKKNKNQFHV